MSNTTRRVRVAVLGGIYHLLQRELVIGPVTLCGLHLQDFMDQDEAEAQGLKLCRHCGEDRG